MVNFLMLLGLRYLCILRGCADWKTQDGTVLSPKKSWEGAVGGVVGAALLTLIYCFVFQGSMGSTNRDIIMLCMICAIGAIISMIGDLTASAIKRNYDIKDYGKLIPGHGGILDRFDSVIFTAPIIYYLALYLIGK